MRTVGGGGGGKGASSHEGFSSRWFHTLNSDRQKALGRAIDAEIHRIRLLSD